MSTFQEELTDLINKHSQENASSTPDYILAQALIWFLEMYARITVERDRWHGWRAGEPWQGGGLLPGNRCPDPLSHIEVRR